MPQRPLPQVSPLPVLPYWNCWDCIPPPCGGGLCWNWVGGTAEGNVGGGAGEEEAIIHGLVQSKA